MTPLPGTARLSVTYPTARVCGRLITRLEEQPLGWAILDAATADEMGREQVGWFIGNHPGIARCELGNSDAWTQIQKAACGLWSPTVGTWHVSCSPIGPIPTMYRSRRNQTTQHGDPERCGLRSLRT